MSDPTSSQPAPDPTSSHPTAAQPAAVPPPPPVNPSQPGVTPAGPGGQLRWAAVVAVAFLVALSAGIGGAVGAVIAAPDEPDFEEFPAEFDEEFRPDVPYPEGEFPDEFEDEYPEGEFPEGELPPESDDGFEDEFEGEFPDGEFPDERDHDESGGEHGGPFGTDEPAGRYRVEGDQLSGSSGDASVDRSAGEIWRRFVALIPEDRRRMVSGFEVMGADYDGAHVYPSDADPTKWVLGVGDGLGDDLDHVLVHEFAHLLTLNAGQVPPSSDPGTERSCTTFFTGEGCAVGSSTIARFVQEFWPEPLQEEIFRIEAIEDEDRYVAELERFWARHADRFVTDYAATNPGEDLAETFTAFVFGDRPSGDRVRDEKVRFLWSDPSMVDLRADIREAL